MLMKCQECDSAATLHVTEMMDGKPVEYHVCATHVGTLESLQPAAGPPVDESLFGRGWFFADPELMAAVRDRDARQKLAAFLLPALCLALADEKPEVRICAVFGHLWLGHDAVSTLGALRDALHDADTRVRRAAELAIAYLEKGPEPFVI
jgi:hypothetical protein